MLETVGTWIKYTDPLGENKTKKFSWKNKSIHNRSTDIMLQGSF